MKHTSDDINFLLSPEAVRETTGRVFQLALDGGTNFKVNLDKLPSCADYVMDVINDNYPSHEIPFHSRWGHFSVGGVNRLEGFAQKLDITDPMEIARTKLDLVITSVLLDAGAGATWKYNEEGVGEFNRSEGLAVASFHLFMSGALSETAKPIADANGLKSFTEKALEEGFQVNATNPLVGVGGRVELLKKLGEAVSDTTKFKDQRPGNIIDFLVEKHGNSFTAKDVLDAVLRNFGSIWPSRIQLGDTNLGDVWHYTGFGEANVENLVCFHKLSQWLTYSLVEPMVEAGLSISGAEKLTGLAEYRNGGLFLDFGVIELRDQKVAEVAHKPSSDLILEWRSLTVTLLDRIGEMVQSKLGKSPKEFPLAKVLEGGTWWAGRRIAKEKREDGSTPLKLDSDGTVF